MTKCMFPLIIAAIILQVAVMPQEESWGITDTKLPLNEIIHIMDDPTRTVEALTHAVVFVNKLLLPITDKHLFYDITDGLDEQVKFTNLIFCFL